MALFLGVFAVVLGAFFSLNWFMRAKPHHITRQIGRVIRFALLILASQGGIFRIFSLILPFIWGFRKFRASKSHQAGAGGQAMDEAEAYAILGLSYGASEAEINDAWRSLMMSAHPDKGGNQEDAARINHARELLLKK